VLWGHTSTVSSAVFSPDGKLALTASWDNTSRIFEVSSGKQLQVLSGHTAAVYSAVFSPDGKLALTASLDDSARIFEVSSGKQLQVLSGHTGRVYSAVFSPDGNLALTASRDETARIFEVSSGKELQLLAGHSDYVYSAVFSPDGKLALTASSDKTARIFEVSSGKELQVLSGHTGRVSSAVFSPDGKYIITTGDDHKIIIWEVATGKALCTRLKLKNNDWLVFDEHYRFDGSPGAIDYLYLTCGLEVIDLSQVKDSLWVPGLAEKIMKGDSILINDRPAPKLKNLNICNLTPIIEPANEGENGLYRYRIIPRNGGLGATEVYINGNLTYSYNPEQLEKRTENKKDVYYLNLAADSLQEFLTGMKGETNPILVKSKVKGSGIYGRGEILNITKESDAKLPAFYGVFVGVNDYGNPEKLSSDLRYNDLSYAAKDANDMANATESVARNLFKDSCHFYRLTGTDSNAPSRANIQNILKEIGLKAKSSDVLFIFFAGHGDLSKNEGDNEIRFILHQADKRNLKSSSFGVAELSLWCHPKNIKAQKRVFVFDACHSGQIINQTMAFNGRGNNEAARIRQLDKLKDKNGMMILAATAENDFAYEDETLNQGVLTFYLLRTIKDSKDTQLIVREWFDDAIEGVKEYSKANGNKQEPNSFGDGRFEVGNVNDTVRRAIQIGCPKIRIASCEFTDPLGSAEKVFPTLKIGISNYFKNGSSRGDFIYSKNYEKSYRVIGSYTMMKKKLVIKYEIKKGDETLGSYSIPPFNTKTESAVLASLTNSILKEIERIDKRDFQCSPYRNRKDQ
jgi:WD40 repeat protein